MKTIETGLKTVTGVKDYLKKATGLSISFRMENGINPNSMKRIKYFVFSCIGKGVEFDFEFSRSFMKSHNAHYCANQKSFYIPESDFLTVEKIAGGLTDYDGVERDWTKY